MVGRCVDLDFSPQHAQKVRSIDPPIPFCIDPLGSIQNGTGKVEGRYKTGLEAKNQNIEGSGPVLGLDPTEGFGSLPRILIGLARCPTYPPKKAKLLP